MESLPELALRCLCRYLADRDVVSCSAVCKSWRRIFDSDIMWFGRSNAALGDHLRNNVSVVDPKFALPDGPLQPPCLLRSACMREKHLWRNWEHGRTNEMVVRRQVGRSDHILAKKWGFLSDNFVYIAFDKTLEVWNVREDVATKVFENVHRLSSQELDSFAIIGDNNEFAIASDGIRAKVFDVDNRVGSISEKYVLDLKTRERIAASSRTDRFELNYATIGSLLFTIVTKISNSIAVWNLNTGQFVKEDQFGMSQSKYGVNMKGSKSSDAIAVVTAMTERQSVSGRAATEPQGAASGRAATDPQGAVSGRAATEPQGAASGRAATEPQGFWNWDTSDMSDIWDMLSLAFKPITNYVHVYCRRRQVFYDFVEAVDGLDQCETTNEFIAFFGEDQILKVFNYRTSELIFQKKAAVYYHVELGHYEVDDSYVLMSVGGHFIYTDIIFDPLSKSERICEIVGYDGGFESMQSIDQLRALGKGGWVLNKETFKFFELRKGRGNTKLGLEIKGTNYIEVSPCCTKIIYLHGAESLSLRIQKLW